MHDEQDIITLAQQIQHADKQLKSTTCHKLGVIMDQVNESHLVKAVANYLYLIPDKDASSPGHGDIERI